MSVRQFALRRFLSILLGILGCLGICVSFAPLTAEEPSSFDFYNASLTDSEAPILTDENAADEEDSLESIQKSMKSLEEEIDSLKKELKKKQNAPDPKKKFTCQLGGLVYADAVMVSQDEENKALYGDIPNQFGFRETRLWAKGEGPSNLSYEVCLGFNNGVSFKNVMATVSDVPVFDHLRVGYFKVESGIGYASMCFYNTFHDFDTNAKTFQLGRRLGLASIHYSDNKNVRLFTGVFTGQNLDFNSDKEYAGVNNDDVGVVLNARLTALPIYQATEDGEILNILHVGGGFRWVDPGKDDAGSYKKTKINAYPCAWLGSVPNMLTGSLETNGYSVSNLELAWQRGRFGVVNEMFLGNYNGFDNAYGVTVTGRYLFNQGAYQKYNKDNGAFAGIFVPENLQFLDEGDYRSVRGTGVWELASQWSWTDASNLEDAAKTGVIYGEMNQFLLALNWHWNSQVRWGLDWIHAMPKTAANKPDQEKISSTNDTLAAEVRFMF